MEQKIVIAKLLQNVTEVCHKLCQVLQSMTDCYYKVRQVLQSTCAIVISQGDVAVRCDHICVKLPQTEFYFLSMTRIT